VASFTERIVVLIDVTAEKATKGLKEFKQAVSEAEGFSGKLKAGVGSLGDTFKAAANNPAVLAGGVAAAAGAAFQAVDAFSNLGVEVGNFSDATGTTTEEASRLIEVSNDLGVSTGSLQSALNKLNKSIDPKAFAELGVAIVTTNSGATDVNATFMNVIDHLNGIKDPAQRAREGTKLLGKSWTDLAELIGMGSAELEKSLSGVSKAKVLSPEQVKKAREFRDAMQNLQDIGEDLVITIGQEFAPALTDAAEGLKSVAENLGPVVKGLGWLQNMNPGFMGLNWIDSLVGKLTGGLGIVDSFKLGWDALWGDDAPAKAAYEVDKTKGALNDTHYVAGLLARGYDVLNDRTRKVAEAAAIARDRFNEARQKLKDLQDEISGRKSLAELQLRLKDNAATLAELKQDYEDGKISAQDYWLKVQVAAYDSQQLVADYAEELGNVPADVATNIVANLDPSSPEQLFATLQSWFDNHKFLVTVGGMVVDSTIRNAMEGRGLPDSVLPPATTTPGRGVDQPGVTTQSLGRGNTTVIQLQLNDRTVQEIMIRGDELKRGRT
jgi:flagellar motility protein MotE (MotC chaperone)